MYLLWNLAILLQSVLCSSLSLHGCKITLLSDPNHITRAFGIATNGAVIGSASTTDRGTRNQKATSPEETRDGSPCFRL